MTVTETLNSLIPTAKATMVIGGLIGTAFMAGIGTILGFGDYAGLPEDVAVLQAWMLQADSSIVSLTSGMEDARIERSQILCLARLTATGEYRTPLEVQQLLENPDEC